MKYDNTRNRYTITASNSAGKTLNMKIAMDKWLMEHPGKIALVIDSKDRTKDYKRYFVPNPQIKKGER